MIGPAEAGEDLVVPRLRNGSRLPVMPAAELVARVAAIVAGPGVELWPAETADRAV